MDERNHDPAVSDTSLDRELAALLDVEPMPDFVARVRADVNARSMSAGTWLTARWIAVAVASVVVALAVTAAWFGRPAPAIVVRQSPVAPSQMIVETPSVVEASPAQADGAAKPLPSQSLPEVLVSPSESASLLRLLMVAREGRVEPSRSPAEDAALNPPMPILIEPLTVAPLVTAELETGAQQ